MTAGQLIAGGVAFGLALILVVGLVRRSSANMKVLMLQMLPIPIAGFAFYVIQPTPLVDSLLVYSPAVLIPLAVVLAVLSQRLMRRIASGRLVTIRDFTLQGALACLTRLCLILSITGYLYGFEPWFAIANLAGNAVWALVWVPRRWRERPAELAIDLASPPGAVWSFITDLANWPKYQAYLVDASVEPPGPIQVGSTITIRRRLGVQHPTRPEFTATVNLVFRVTELVPNHSYTTLALGRGTRSTILVEAAGTGSRLTIRAAFWMSTLDGYLGTALQLPWMVAEYRRTTQQSLDRLRDAMAAA